MLWTLFYEEKINCGLNYIITIFSCKGFSKNYQLVAIVYQVGIILILSSWNMLNSVFTVRKNIQYNINNEI